MKVRSNRLYPYPVLSNNSNDFVNNKFEVLKDIEYDSEIATIVLKTAIEDKTILKLLEENRIGLFCNVECSVTKYRFMFEVPYSSLDEYRYDLDISQLNDNIELACILVAKENISFMSDDLNNFYKGEVINYPKYSTIGFTETDEISLIKQIDVNGDIPSIFSITSSDSAKEIYYEYEEHQINIYLPREQYDIYYNSRGSSKRLKQMMINLPVLESVLDDLKTDDSISDRHGWYKVLESAISKLGYESFEEDRFRNEPSIKIAQQILGDISKDAFNEFEVLRMKGE